MELIRFNLFDNATFETYLTTEDRPDPRASGPRCGLPPDDPAYGLLGIAADGAQPASGDLIRFRTWTAGICNDIRNPAMGSAGQLFTRNVDFEVDLSRSRPRSRSRRTATATGSRPGTRPAGDQPPAVHPRYPNANAADCNSSATERRAPTTPNCDYRKAPFFNVLAAFWIQFMTHDWFAAPRGCAERPGQDHGEPRLRHANDGDTSRAADPGARRRSYGCRPEDTMEAALDRRRDAIRRPSLETTSEPRLARAHRTTSRNLITAWWDASQIYGYDERSRARVKRDPERSRRSCLVGSAGRRRRAAGLSSRLRRALFARCCVRRRLRADPAGMGRPGGGRVPRQLVDRA